MTTRKITLVLAMLLIAGCSGTPAATEAPTTQPEVTQPPVTAPLVTEPTAPPASDATDPPSTETSSTIVEELVVAATVTFSADGLVLAGLSPIGPGEKVIVQFINNDTIEHGVEMTNPLWLAEPDIYDDGQPPLPLGPGESMYIEISAEFAHLNSIIRCGLPGHEDEQVDIPFTEDVTVTTLP